MTGNEKTSQHLQVILLPCSTRVAAYGLPRITEIRDAERR
jgi:hypothetical protein